ncbi:AAC(3) family N-acetyltransferase [Nonomuraea maheshkhaliensis]|uniref:Aminoglycoside N(3)-acetyltransferase n=1 Tax=Nonomuraea maheshkhaliensis TaxID=419590 RepID=A0ABN2F2G5_9ACTN
MPGPPLPRERTPRTEGRRFPLARPIAARTVFRPFIADTNRRAPSHTAASLAAQLRGLGLEEGQTILVHTSLRAIGRMKAGPATLMAALLTALGPRKGTVVVPTFTSSNSTTSRVYREAIRDLSGEAVDRYHDSMPAFEARTTPSIECGLFSEEVRTHRRSVRSDHPQTSFAAVGAQARRLMADHPRDHHLGLLSPLGKMVDSKAMVLLLGVGYDRCSAFHLAEYTYTEQPPTMLYRCKVSDAGKASWFQYSDVLLDDSDFALCGTDMERDVKVVSGMVGDANSRIFSMADAVQFAEQWFRAKRRRIEKG